VEHSCHRRLKVGDHRLAKRGGVTRGGCRFCIDVGLSLGKFGRGMGDIET